MRITIILAALVVALFALGGCAELPSVSWGAKDSRSMVNSDAKAPELPDAPVLKQTVVTQETLPSPEPVQQTVEANPGKLPGKEFHWKHFGVDPYAKSREAAMHNRVQAFRKLGFPEAVAVLFAKETEKPGETTFVTNGSFYSAMLVGGGAVKKNVRVDFEKPKVPQKIEYATRAESWKVEWQGKVYVLTLPEVCYNWLASLPEWPTPPPVASVPPTPPVVRREVGRPAACPDGLSLTGNYWLLQDIPDDLLASVMKNIAAAKKADSGWGTRPEAYKGDRVSRSDGDALIERVTNRLPVDADVHVYLLDLQTLHVERDLGIMQVRSGVGVLKLPNDAPHYIIVSVWPGLVSSSFIQGQWYKVLSPVTSAGKLQLWLFPDEWFRRKDEKNPCRKDEHSITTPMVLNSPAGPLLHQAGQFKFLYSLSS